MHLAYKNAELGSAPLATVSTVSHDFFLSTPIVRQTVHHSVHNVQMVSHLFVNPTDSCPWFVNTRHLYLLQPLLSPYQCAHQPGERRKKCSFRRRFHVVNGWMSTWGRRSRFVPQISWKLNFAPVLIKVCPTTQRQHSSKYRHHHHPPFAKILALVHYYL